MPPRETLVVTWPLESVKPLFGSKTTPDALANSTSAPGTAVPCSSFTCTTTGCGNKLPACANCFPPLDSTIAAPNAVGLGSGADSDWREQLVANSVASIATATMTAELRWGGQPKAAVPRCVAMP